MHSMKSSGSGGMAEFKDLLATLSDPKKFQERIDALESKHSAASEADKVANEKILLAKELEASLKVVQEDLETMQLKLDEKEKQLQEIEAGFGNRESKIVSGEKDLAAKKESFEQYKSDSMDDLAKEQAKASAQMNEAASALAQAKEIQKDVDHRMARMKAALT